jgi:hypothetical protein
MDMIVQLRAPVAFRTTETRNRPVNAFSAQERFDLLPLTTTGDDAHRTAPSSVVHRKSG